MQSVGNGGLALNHIMKYYVKDLMEKTKKKKSKFSVEEVFSSKELIGFCVGTVLSNSKVYANSSLTKNVEAVCRIGGKGCVSSATGFPIKTVDYIIKKYNRNGIVYDFSCGWGSRMLGTLRNGCSYLGTDPNYQLVDRLNNMAEEFININNLNNTIDIRPHGSQTYIPEWKGVCGLAFSSPPYYDEEDYIIGDQSYKDGISYAEWLNTYMVPTVKNIYKYLTDDGIFCINVKDIIGHHLEDDTIGIILQNGFELLTSETLLNSQRPHPTIGKVDNSEKIYVFNKK